MLARLKRWLADAPERRRLQRIAYLRERRGECERLKHEIDRALADTVAEPAVAKLREAGL